MKQSCQVEVQVVEFVRVFFFFFLLSESLLLFWCCALFARRAERKFECCLDDWRLGLGLLVVCPLENLAVGLDIARLCFLESEEISALTAAAAITSSSSSSFPSLPLPWFSSSVHVASLSRRSLFFSSPSSFVFYRRCNLCMSIVIVATTAELIVGRRGVVLTLKLVSLSLTCVC